MDRALFLSTGVSARHFCFSLHLVARILFPFALAHAVLALLAHGHTLQTDAFDMRDYLGSKGPYREPPPEEELPAPPSGCTAVMVAGVLRCRFFWAIFLP